MKFHTAKIDLRGGNAISHGAKIDLHGGDAVLHTAKIDLRGGNVVLHAAKIDLRGGNVILHAPKSICPVEMPPRTVPMPSDPLPMSVCALPKRCPALGVPPSGGSSKDPVLRRNSNGY